MDMLRIKDGRIAEGWVSWDALTLVEQLTGLGEGSEDGFLSLVDRLHVR
jgi:hypothetical protein